MGVSIINGWVVATFLTSKKDLGPIIRPVLVHQDPLDLDYPHVFFDRASQARANVSGASAILWMDRDSYFKTCIDFCKEMPH